MRSPVRHSSDKSCIPTHTHELVTISIHSLELQIRDMRGQIAILQAAVAQRFQSQEAVVALTEEVMDGLKA